MATYTVGAGDYIREFRNAESIRHYPEGTGQSFILGDVLIKSAVSLEENCVIISGADNVTTIVGIAAEKASGVQGTDITVWQADSDKEFLACIDDTSTILATMLGKSFGLVKDVTNKIWRVDTTDTTNVSVKVTELIDPVGTVNGRVAFVFLPGVRLPYPG